MPVIFPHVPKAGGTSIRVQLVESGLKVLLDYKSPPGTTPWHRQRARIRRRQIELLDVASYDIVFGHFPITRYDQPGNRYVALVRDPIERAISQYHYHISRAKLPHLKPQQKLFYESVASGRVGFYEYCRRSGAGNIYNLFLSRWDRSRFALIGNTARFGDFVERFNAMFGTRLSDDTHMRKREDNDIVIPEADIEKLKLMLADELAWYRDFVQAS